MRKHCFSLVAILALLTLAGSASDGASNYNSEQRPAWARILPGYWYHYGDFPALYHFRSDKIGDFEGTGVRTTYPTGTLSYGQPFAFAWSLKGDKLRVEYASGYSDTIQLESYNSKTDTIQQSSSGLGSNPWYGCGSGRIPKVIADNVCR